MAAHCPPPNNLQFGKYLEAKSRPEWREQYINYKKLKDLIKASAEEAAQVGREGRREANPGAGGGGGRTAWRPAAVVLLGILVVHS